jgi:tRNA G26 N,N-dimethylase Trm1
MSVNAMTLMSMTASKYMTQRKRQNNNAQTESTIRVIVNSNKQVAGQMKVRVAKLLPLTANWRHRDENSFYICKSNLTSRWILELLATGGI